MASQENAIVVKDVYKTFKLPHEQHSGIKQAVINVFNPKRGYETQKVLQDLSFEIKKGEFFGIVGRNGSGKSTLLKLLAGIYAPDKGLVQVNGSLTPFIELGVGFNPELTGRENVFLNGALLGFSKKEIEQMYEDIIDFAELEKFMDQKLKNYSSGMQVRLAFSIAVRAKSDILLLDEVLAVGDESFQKKCYQYFAEIRRQKQTVILVTHGMDIVQQFCDRAMLIDKGHKTEIGTPLNIAQIYRELNDQEGITVNKNNKEANIGTKYVETDTNFINEESKLRLKVNLMPHQNLNDPIVAVEIFRDSGEQLIRWVTDEKIKKPIKLEAGKKVCLDIAFQNIFPVGRYSVRLLVRKRDRSMDYGVFNDVANFEIKNKSPYKGNVYWRPEEDFSLKVSDG